MDEEPRDIPEERSFDPAAKALEQSNQFRVHAEIAAVFEGVRKWEAQLRPGLDVDIARQVQRAVAKLEKAKPADSPVIPIEAANDAADVLNLFREKELSTNDYHIHRRPGEVMIVRWLEGDEVAAFYERLQAHFDAALGSYRAEERSATEWKNDPKITKYLEILDAMDVKMPERYLREPIRKHGIFVLSTQTADELDILYLTEHVMAIPPADLVGRASTPPDEPTEQDRAWFYKLFLLRGQREGVEQMCFFTFLQKTDDGSW